MPPELHEQAVTVADRLGLQLSTLAYMAIVQAYHVVCDASAAGMEPGLPGPVPLPQRPEVAWWMPREHWDQCRAAILAADSTVEATVNEWFRRFVAGDGSLEAQRWPKQRTRRLEPERLQRLRDSVRPRTYC